ncbi:1,4-alpha-glucan branching protein [Actinosynnema sp. ALI-1.44]|nr:1,4-alpha-glucan branching protein [Actinosynnema sp. ALI-1.44]
MAVVHQVSLKPGKLELLTAWLPSRPWYRGGEPKLARAGGFRLDDPRGEVGIEFMVVADTSGDSVTVYLLPLTYRGAALDGADHALVGTTDHETLGRRWVYDGCHDPVLVAQLLALIQGEAQAQDQDVSDTPDREVVCSHTGGRISTDLAATDNQEGTELRAADGTLLQVCRVLRPTLDSQGATGHVSTSWQLPNGTRVWGLLAVLRAP